jgi:hypothetical protein
MGRRQGGVGEASRFVFWEEGAKRERFAYTSQPSGAAVGWLFFRVARSSHIDLDMLVVTASPARTALKNSQLIRQWPGERDAYFRGQDTRILEKQN